MSERDAIQDARTEAIKESLDRHLDACEKRSEAVWTEIGKVRDKVDALRWWIVGAGLAAVAAEGGFFAFVVSFFSP